MITIFLKLEAIKLESSNFSFGKKKKKENSVMGFKIMGI